MQLPGEQRHVQLHQIHDDVQRPQEHCQGSHLMIQTSCRLHLVLGRSDTVGRAAASRHVQSLQKAAAERQPLKGSRCIRQPLKGSRCGGDSGYPHIDTIGC